jgi:hypothetical protein
MFQVYEWLSSEIGMQAGSPLAGAVSKAVFRPEGILMQGAEI